MYLFELLKLQEPAFDPLRAKVHLARHEDQPIAIYRRGEFDEWQRWQSKKNFERELVVSLVQSEHDIRRWLFVGVYRTAGCTTRPDAPKYLYNLTRLASTAEYEGRLFVRSVYKERQPYVYAETLAQDLTIEELLPERLSVGQFPGYKQLNISKADLDLVVRNNVESWRAALASVKGIYLITDVRTGKLYVGKADGETGIWGRWCEYSCTGHGHNKALIRELGQEAGKRQEDLWFSLLEIADLQSGPGEIGRRESHWKEILRSRQTGYNLN